MKNTRQNSFFHFRSLLILLFAFCYSLAAYAERVYLFTTDRGTFSPMYMGSVYLKNPKQMQKDGFGVGGMERQEWENSVRFSGILKGMQEKGYEIIVKESAPPTDFFKAIEDPKTVLILHEGHGIRNEAQPDIVALEIGGKPLARDALDSYLASVGRKKLEISTGLKFIYTQACYGQLSENYYRPKWKLPGRVQWIGSDESVDPYNTPQLFDVLEQDVLRKFPEIGSPQAIRIVKGSRLE